VRMRRLVAPFTGRATYRRWTYLILGGALLVPYLLFATLIVPSVLPIAADPAQALVIGTLLMVAVLAATSLIPAVRVLEGAAVRELLDDPVPEATYGREDSLRVRSRAGAMFVLHVLTGGVVAFLSLVLPVLLAFGAAVPFTGRLAIGPAPLPQFPRGWASAWIPAVLILATLLLFFLVAATGAGLRRAAQALLGVPAAERIAQLERRGEQLAERNRLARELHDSVGHALSVVNLQAGAARRTLRRDPDTAERALGAIEDSVRSALEDLDHVLGLLREERAERAPRKGLGELPALLTATRLAGLDIALTAHGDLDRVPPVVSRQAYRIVQESLTNVLRHAGKVPVALALDIAGDELRVTVRNPVESGRGRARAGGGRGLRGITERVEALGGEVRAGRNGQCWEVAVRLPTGGRRAGETGGGAG
jgi:signal transduction histidine kinase